MDKKLSGDKRKPPLARRIVLAAGTLLGVYVSVFDGAEEMGRFIEDARLGKQVREAIERDVIPLVDEQAAAATTRH